MKTIDGPYQYVSSPTATVLPALKNARYLIHTIGLSVRMAAAKTTTGVYVSFYQGGVAHYFYLHVVPGVAAAYSRQFILDIETDENTAVTYAADVEAPTESNIGISYKVVPA